VTIAYISSFIPSEDEMKQRKWIVAGIVLAGMFEWISDWGVAVLQDGQGAGAGADFPRIGGSQRSSRTKLAEPPILTGQRTKLLWMMRRLTSSG
jgi:hypothetical protein